MSKALVAQWIEKTREEVEKDRVEKIIKVFFENFSPYFSFSFVPKVEWINNGERVLKASVEVDVNDEMIEGRKITKVEFCVTENPFIISKEDWKISKFTRGGRTIYKWKKYEPQYKIYVEIITE